MPAADRAKRLSLLTDSSVATQNRVLVNGVRIAKWLREARLNAGLTQAQLAERTGIHRPIVARIEGGRHEATLTTIERIATACGASVSDVFRRE